VRRVARLGFGYRAAGNQLLCQFIGLSGSSEKLERIEHGQSFSRGVRVASGAFIRNKSRNEESVVPCRGGPPVASDRLATRDNRIRKKAANEMTDYRGFDID